MIFSTSLFTLAQRGRPATGSHRSDQERKFAKTPPPLHSRFTLAAACWTDSGSLIGFLHPKGLAAQWSPDASQGATPRRPPARGRISPHRRLPPAAGRRHQLHSAAACLRSLNGNVTLARTSSIGNFATQNSTRWVRGRRGDIQHKASNPGTPCPDIMRCTAVGCLGT